MVTRLCIEKAQRALKTVAMSLHIGGVWEGGLTGPIEHSWIMLSHSSLQTTDYTLCCGCVCVCGSTPITHNKRSSIRLKGGGGWRVACVAYAHPRSFATFSVGKGLWGRPGDRRLISYSTP